MLQSLMVKNLAVVREAEVNFGEGLTILSGETGAGKSVIIGSIGYALGAKVDKDVIRQGAEYALVELVFFLEKESEREAVRAMDLPIEEDGTLILCRKIMPGRSVLKVCGETVTARQAKDLAALLIDIHGQHEHQSLLKNSKHRQMLDAYCGEKHNARLTETAILYREYLGLKERIDKLTMEDAGRVRELSLAKYEIDEIEAAAPLPGEEQELETKRRKMDNFKKIADSLRNVMEIFEDNNGGVLDRVGRAAGELDGAATLDPDLAESASSLATAEDMLRSIRREVEDYLESSSFDPNEYEEIETRLDLLRRLMLKYGGSIEAVLDYCEKRKNEAAELEDLDATLGLLQGQLRTTSEQLERVCAELHKERVKQAKALEKEITTVLMDLNFLKVAFEIRVMKKDEYGFDGYDEVEFLISLNPGEEKRPLSEVASGGELSRIMLALKSVFARKDEIDTLIFDEIDTGISGKTAWMVSEKMASLGKDHQVICITHLPQIAAMADQHFVISKAEVDGKTETRIRELDDIERVEEVGRMLGGDEITDTVRRNARELIEKADDRKKEIREV